MADLRNTIDEKGPKVLLSLIVFAYLGVVLVAPVAALVVESVTAATADTAERIDVELLRGALERSLVLAAIAAVVNGALGVGAGYVVARHRFPGRALLDSLSDLPLAVSPVMIGLAFILLFGRDGWLEPLTAEMGVQVVFAFPGMALATLFVTLPYTMREVVYVLEEIGTSEEEAARTLGASPVMTFLLVTLPNLRYAIGYGVLMTTARALGEFGAVLILGGSIAGVTQTATTLVHDALEERQDLTAYAVAAALAAISLLLLALLEWARQKEETP